MPEFTGERVVPGLVDADLYNEHMARYEFALQFVKGVRVLDAGCGSGYGSAVLAGEADSVRGIDISDEAIEFARFNFTAPNLDFQLGTCSSLPPGPFDVIVAFEVIEHLADWPKFLAQARGVLSPNGRFLVSTPNKAYYADSRGGSGKNPFHVHEFTLEEFRTHLNAVFPRAEMFFQNHITGVAIASSEPLRPILKLGVTQALPEEANFFLAVCSVEDIKTSQDAFVWVPGTGNILRERERHIGLLANELANRVSELHARNGEYESLLQRFRELNEQLEIRNRWALQAQAESEERGARIQQLQQELLREQDNFSEIAAKYQAKLSELDATNRAKTEWALDTERRLTLEIQSQSDELAKCVALLDQAEQTVVERTLWAQSLRQELDRLTAETAELRAQRWVKLGTRFGFVSQKDP